MLVIESAQTSDVTARLKPKNVSKTVFKHALESAVCGLSNWCLCQRSASNYHISSGISCWYPNSVSCMPKSLVMITWWLLGIISLDVRRRISSTCRLKSLVVTPGRLRDGIQLYLWPGRPSWSRWSWLNITQSVILAFVTLVFLSDFCRRNIHKQKFVYLFWFEVVAGLVQR